MITTPQNKKQGGNIASEHKELYGEAEKLDIVDKAVSVLTEVLLGESILRELPAYRNIFLRVCNFDWHIYGALAASDVLSITSVVNQTWLRYEIVIHENIQL